MNKVQMGAELTRGLGESSQWTTPVAQGTKLVCGHVDLTGPRFLGLLGAHVLAQRGGKCWQQAGAAETSGAHPVERLTFAVPAAPGGRPVLQCLAQLLPDRSAITCRHRQQASAAQRLGHGISGCQRVVCLQARAASQSWGSRPLRSRRSPWLLQSAMLTW